MKLTKYTHSCVRMEADRGALVIDPGGFSTPDELERALDGVDAVLVTHEHPDHIDVDTLTRLLAERPTLRLWGPAPVVDLLGEHQGQATVVGGGESFEAGGLPITTYGGQHALIHPSIPVVANVGYLVNEEVLHPGDSFVVPPEPVETLLLALHAPWSKVAEVLDHVVAVRAPVVHPIHDGLLNDRGRGLVEGHVDRVASTYGCRYESLSVGDVAD